MDLVSFLRHARHLFPALLLEAPVILGLVLFALSWLWRRPWVALPRDARRRRILSWLGIAGSLAVIAVTLVVTLIAAAEGYDSTGVAGWWRRPAPLLAAALAVGIAAIAISREPLPAPGESVISPRRYWWSFTPKAPLWCVSIAVAILGLTSLWQASVTSLLPRGAQLISTPHADGSTEIRPTTPDEQVLPVGPFVDNPSGGGWLNNGVTLLALVALVVILIVALSRDANHPVSVRSTAPSIRDNRETVARMYVVVALGGVLVTLGMLWMFVGYIGGWSVMVEASNETAPGLPPGDLGAIALTPFYADFAEVFRLGGWLLQGIGTALLLRLAVDTVRARRAVQQELEADAAEAAPETEHPEAVR